MKTELRQTSRGGCCVCFCLGFNSTLLNNDPLLQTFVCLSGGGREKREKRKLQNMVVVVLSVTPSTACVASLLISNTKAKRSGFQPCHLVWGSLCLAEGRGLRLWMSGQTLHRKSKPDVACLPFPVCQDWLPETPNSIYCTRLPSVPHRNAAKVNLCLCRESLHSATM